MAYDFTDRFIELPIKIFSTTQKELTGKAEYFDNTLYLLPEEISNFKAVRDDDCDVEECVSVFLKNGESFHVYLTLEEFKNQLNAHAAYNGI